jgi:lycopene beta-cyclase
MEKKEIDFIICGGGISGLLLANALNKDSFFKDHHILLIEKETKNTNDRTLCFWEQNSGSFDLLLFNKWSMAQFSSDKLKLEFDLSPYNYKMLRSKKFYAQYSAELKNNKNITLIKAKIKNFKSEDNSTIVYTDQGSFISKFVFNSIFNPKTLYNQKKYPVLQQHFIGWFINTAKASFDPEKILFMDFDIPQNDLTRFIYVLPFDSQNALVEYTLFSEHLINNEDYENGIREFLSSKRISNYTINEVEQGSIPMSCFPLEKLNTPSLMHIGTAGGWTKASTGFTFMNTNRQVSRLVEFLKQKKTLNTFKTISRYRFYDLLFIDVLSKHNGQGSKLFERMFLKNSPLTIFRFLDEETTFIEELKIMSSFTYKQMGWFLKALLNRFFLKFALHQILTKRFQ